MGFDNNLSQDVDSDQEECLEPPEIKSQLKEDEIDLFQNASTAATQAKKLEEEDLE